MKYTKQMSIDYNLSESDYNAIVASAKAAAQDYIDPFTDEMNATPLAEWVAYDLGYDEWLDEETHPLWDVCAELAINHNSAL